MSRNRGVAQLVGRYADRQAEYVIEDRDTSSSNAEVLSGYLRIGAVMPRSNEDRIDFQTEDGEVISAEIESIVGEGDMPCESWILRFSAIRYLPETTMADGR